MTIGIDNSLLTFVRLSTALLALLFSQALSLAQYVINGNVVNEKSGEPVSGAFVYSYDGDSLTGYSLSQNDGQFIINLPLGKKADHLTVTCLGFKSVTVSMSEQGVPYRIELDEEEVLIREAKVVAYAVEEKGDTLSYSAAAFSDGEEASLGDLLKKLPGISITPSGGILYEGQYINKFYVEGMDLMGNQYGVITKNLPAGKIAAVEVYKRHQPVRALSGISETDRGAVNIILKEGAKSTWMVTGDALAGAPELPLLDSRILLTRFSKNRQDLFLVKGNNIGRDIIKELTAQQYFGKTGAFLLSNDNIDSDFQSRLNPKRLSLPVPQEYWYDNVSGIGSFNHLRKYGNDFLLRSSLQTAAEKNYEMSLSSERINFDEDNSMTINESKSANDVKYYLAGKISAEKNTIKRFLLNELSFSGQVRDNSSNLTGGLNETKESYSLPSFKIENNLDVTFRSQPRQAVTLSSKTKYVSNNHDADYLTDNFSAHQSFFQKEFVSENSVKSSIRLKGVRLNITGGLDIEYQGIDTELTGLSGIDVTTESSMDVFSGAPNVTLSGTVFIGKTEVSLSLPARLNVISRKPLKKMTAFTDFNPRLAVKRVFSSSWKADGALSYNSTRTGIESLLPSSVMSGYRSISASDSLSRRKGLSALATLGYSDNASFLYASVSASFNKKSSDRTASSEYSSLFTFTGFELKPMSMSSSSLSGKISKFFGLKTFVINLSGGWYQSEEKSYLQEIIREYSIDNLNATLNLRANPIRWLSIDASASYEYSAVSESLSYTDQSVSRSVSLNGSLMVKPLKQLSVITIADWLYERTPGTSVSNIPLFKTEVVWKLKQMSLVAQCRNILDCKEFSRNYINTFSTFSSTVSLPGRQFLFGIRLSL